ncbi:hypothetical protein [Rhizobium sp. LjRoot258]|uniref:hypothetical protein n=1 Tax=Rhizobium sp. LjRoot258 TaxID=3342299 RepID=UPI003ECEB922
MSTLTAGGQMPAEVIIQVKGSGLEIPFECFRQVFRESTDFREILLRCQQSFFVQRAYTALSNATHRLEERCLARWTPAE